MPDLQPTEPSAAGAIPALLEAAPASEEIDFAFGCECADPALQIERWNEPPSASADAS
jgi:hypothetical protein